MDIQCVNQVVVQYSTSVFVSRTALKTLMFAQHVNLSPFISGSLCLVLSVWWKQRASGAPCAYPRSQRGGGWEITVEESPPLASLLSSLDVVVWVG